MELPLIDLQPTVAFLRSAPGAVLLTHERPDGDALGSVAGVARHFRSRGLPAEVWLYDRPPERYAFLLEGLFVKTVAPGRMPPAGPLPWIVCDTCTWNQLTPVAEAIKARGGADWVFDHHLARDPVHRDGLLDTSASATGLLVYESLAAAGSVPDEGAASALFTAIATDTGWFRFSNADARTYRAAGALVELGVAPDVLYDRLFQNDSLGRVGLVLEALDSLELFENGRVATMILTQEGFRRARATSADTENLTDEAARIRGVNVVALLVEMQDGRVRCSFRSKRDVDVNELAKKFGGGGHARAAGARITGTVPEVKTAVLAALTEAMRAV